MAGSVDSTLAKLGLPIDIPDMPILCPQCKNIAGKGVPGPGTRLQFRCRRTKCKLWFWIDDTMQVHIGRDASIPSDRIKCPRCRNVVTNGTLGPGTRLQFRCREKCKGEDGKALLFPVVSL